ncbi:hypothetical protein HY992_00320 [Candidatus Micrarchaeota archaeon]|nr:hypothetical protein [Candidatus Micrarchaeota archaeon]
MKCPICSGELEGKEDGVHVGKEELAFSAFKCRKCGEELVFEEDFDSLMKNALDLKAKHHYSKQISYSGNSLILRIPRELAKLFSLKEGTNADISLGKEGFFVKLAKPRGSA